jgi:[protein-PII] uridylyltransferase
MIAPVQGQHDTGTPVTTETVLLSAEDIRLANEVTTRDGTGIDWQKIEARLNEPGTGLDELRHLLACGTAALTGLFVAEEPISKLVHDRARLVDLIILAAWRNTAGDLMADTVLAAVGGYGRGELHPGSDVDLLILLENDTRKSAAQDAVAAFLTLLWDVGLEVGHSTRTVKDCQQESRKDITVTTTLMESRLLCGPDTLFQQMTAAVGPDEVWPSRIFFEAKLKEQQARHARYDDTAYNLEPNVKGSPGGLRDIQMIVWVARRHFGTGRLKGLKKEGFLTRGQLRLLRQGRDLLWRIRFALHILTGRREDRLLFDHQARIAALFGYEDATYMLAVEQLMQRYYRTVMDLSRLNEMLLQLFQEAILMNPDVKPEPINRRFQIKNGFLQITDDSVFETRPSALLELFLLLQQNPEIKGVSSMTITAIKQNLQLIDDEFRQDPRNHQLFLQILRAPKGVTHELRRMNRYGVLGRYIPAFGRIVGRMQYDLFHVYTVDAHTLFVVSNIRRFVLSRFDHEFPGCSDIMQSLPTPEVLYLAGLFHDIAKGRGGDHSVLGAVDAESFCLEHGLSRYEARLVAWLVRHHLTLSLTAQKKDTSDPAVIRAFAEQVGDEIHLDYLYLLTVADVRATNPKLWNAWRARLFEELYVLTKQALRRGLENPIDKDELLDEKQLAARKLLQNADIDETTIDGIWAGMSEEYFLRCKPEEIDSHTRLLADPLNRDARILIDFHDQTSSAGTAVFIFTPQQSYTFAIATAVLDELGLNIADARIIPLTQDDSLAIFVVLEQSGNQILESTRMEQIKRRLENALEKGDEDAPTVTRRAPRQVRMFTTQTHVSFATDENNQRTVMELTAGDRPGLLCEVGKVLRDKRIVIQTAKVVTAGERAEDVFYITDDTNDEPLSPERCEELKSALIDSLENAGG